MTNDLNQPQPEAKPDYPEVVIRPMTEAFDINSERIQAARYMHGVNFGPDYGLDIIEVNEALFLPENLSAVLDRITNKVAQLNLPAEYEYLKAGYLEQFSRLRNWLVSSEGLRDYRSYLINHEQIHLNQDREADIFKVGSLVMSQSDHWFTPDELPIIQAQKVAAVIMGGLGEVEAHSKGLQEINLSAEAITNIGLLSQHFALELLSINENRTILSEVYQALRDNNPTSLDAKGRGEYHLAFLIMNYGNVEIMEQIKNGALSIDELQIQFAHKLAVNLRNPEEYIAQILNPEFQDTVHTKMLLEREKVL